jgi:hypothetical protein
MNISLVGIRNRFTKRPNDSESTLSLKAKGVQMSQNAHYQPFMRFMLASPKMESTPLRFLRGHQAPVPLLAAADRTIPATDFGTAVRPDREAIRARVMEARNIQVARFRKARHQSNAAMSPREVKAHCQLDAESTGYLEHAMEEMNFSARAHDRILKVARTLADLGASETIRPEDILEAIQFRSLDRKLFS